MNDLQPLTLARLEAKLDSLTEAVTKLVLLEERQITQAQRLTAVESKQENLETAQRELEKKVDRLINRGVGIWAVVTIIGAATFTIGIKLVH